MAISFVAASSVRVANSNYAQLAHTISSGSDILLLVAIALTTHENRVSSVTWGGTELTQHHEGGENQGDKAWIWVGTIPLDAASGAGTLVVTLTSSVGRWCIGLCEYTGVSQAADPFRNSAVTNSGVNPSYSLATATDSDGLAVSAAALNSGKDATPGDTERVDQASASPTQRIHMMEASGTGSPVTMNASNFADDTFYVWVNCLQVPQNITITPAQAEVVTSASVGTVIEGTDTIIIGRTASVIATARVGAVAVIEPIRADLIMNVTEQ